MKELRTINRILESRHNETMKLFSNERFDECDVILDKTLKHKEYSQNINNYGIIKKGRVLIMRKQHLYFIFYIFLFCLLTGCKSNDEPVKDTNIIMGGFKSKSSESFGEYFYISVPNIKEVFSFL